MPRPVLHLGPLHSVHTRRWAENARDLGYAVHVAGELRPGADPVIGDAAESVHVAPGAVTGLNIAMRVPWLRRLANRLHPELVHAHLPPLWGIAATLAGTGPRLVSAWGSEVYLAPWRLRVRSRVALRRASLVSAPSPDLCRAVIAAGARPDRCVQIDIGIDLESFSPGEAPAGLLEYLALDPGPIVLSFRGGSPTYRLPVVVDAFRRLRAVVPSVRLVMIAERSALPPEVLAALESRNLGGSFAIHPPVSHAELPKLFRAASVGVSVPSSDGSPQSVWEGLACGLPMVLSDLPQIHERDLEGAARLVPADPAAIASALAETIRDPDPGANRARARNWACANVDRAAELERLDRAYRRVVGV